MGNRVGIVQTVGELCHQAILMAAPRAATLHLRQTWLHWPPQLLKEGCRAFLKRICLCHEKAEGVWRYGGTFWA